MAWTNSKIFRPYLADVLNNTTAMDTNSDTFKNALYDNDITPDQNATAANTAYNAGQWTASGNEVSESGQWAAGGVALASVTLDAATSGVVFFDAADTASGSAADLANMYGCLIYDDTITTPVADQGLAFLYFGGSNSVVNGTFTCQYHANGIFRFTL